MKLFSDNSRNHNFFLKIEILEIEKIETTRTKIQNGFFAREGHLSAWLPRSRSWKELDPGSLCREPCQLVLCHTSSSPILQMLSTWIKIKSGTFINERTLSVITKIRQDYYTRPRMAISDWKNEVDITIFVTKVHANRRRDMLKPANSLQFATALANNFTESEQCSGKLFLCSSMKVNFKRWPVNFCHWTRFVLSMNLETLKLKF